MITNNDGSPYRLRGPNPIMTGQVIWSGAITHNLDEYEEISYIPRSWRFKEIKNEEKKEEHLVVNEVSAPTTVTLELDSPDKMKCWVLPTEIKTSIDPLYGQESIRMVWGKKFSMEIAFEQIGDIFSVFWTNAIKSITAGSIIYVEMRHWKVDSFSKSENGDGILINCSITDQTPSFG